MSRFQTTVDPSPTMKTDVRKMHVHICPSNDVFSLDIARRFAEWVNASHIPIVHYNITLTAFCHHVKHVSLTV